MKCFTVFELDIHDFIPVVEKGIGINGQLATISEGINFPKPDMGYISNSTGIHPFAPARAQVIMRADCFQYKDPHTKIGSTPIIINNNNDESGRALVLWVVSTHGPYHFDRLHLHNAQIIVGPVCALEYNQYLISMFNEDSDVLAHTADLHLINLHYSHGILKIEKT